MSETKDMPKHKHLWFYFITTTRPIETKDSEKMPFINVIQALGNADVKLKLKGVIEKDV